MCVNVHRCQPCNHVTNHTYHCVTLLCDQRRWRSCSLTCQCNKIRWPTSAPLFAKQWRWPTRPQIVSIILRLCRPTQARCIGLWRTTGITKLSRHRHAHEHYSMYSMLLRKGLGWDGHPPDASVSDGEARHPGPPFANQRRSALARQAARSQQLAEQTRQGEHDASFKPAKKFDGARPGMAYKRGPKGLG